MKIFERTTIKMDLEKKKYIKNEELTYLFYLFIYRIFLLYFEYLLKEKTTKTL